MEPCVPDVLTTNKATHIYPNCINIFMGPRIPTKYTAFASTSSRTASEQNSRPYLGQLGDLDEVSLNQI
jgi:hypothetical protein